jgi:hypothetical protein
MFRKKLQRKSKHIFGFNIFSNTVPFWVFLNYCRGRKAQMTIWRMRIACWISTATDKHSEYIIQWVRKVAVHL